MVPIMHPRLVICKPDKEARISLFFGNTIYLVALCYYSVISFLGYNGTIFIGSCLSRIRSR